MEKAPKSPVRIRFIGTALCLVAFGGFWWQYLCFHNGELFSPTMALVAPLLLGLGLTIAVDVPHLPIRLRDLSPLGRVLMAIAIGSAIANYAFVLHHTTSAP